MMDKISNFLKQDNVKYLIIALLLVQIILVARTPNSILNLYVTVEGRIIVALIVAYLAHISPMLSIAVTITYVIALREARIRSDENNSEILKTNIEKDPRKDSVKSTAQDIDDVVRHYGTSFFGVFGMGNKKDVKDDVKDNVKDNVKDASNNINNKAPEDLGHPADKTLTDNIQLESPEFRQLDVVQTNDVGVELMDAFGNVEEDNSVSGFNSQSSKHSLV